MRVRKEKEDEVERREQQKRDYEKRIKDLEDQINILKNESGDIVQQLEKKIKQMTVDFEQDKEQQQRLHIREKESERKRERGGREQERERGRTKRESEKRIKDLEDQINILKNESGDIVQ